MKRKIVITLTKDFTLRKHVLFERLGRPQAALNEREKWNENVTFRNMPSINLKVTVQALTGWNNEKGVGFLLVLVCIVALRNKPETTNNAFNLFE